MEYDNQFKSYKLHMENTGSKKKEKMSSLILLKERPIFEFIHRFYLMFKTGRLNFIFGQQSNQVHVMDTSKGKGFAINLI